MIDNGLSTRGHGSALRGVKQNINGAERLQNFSTGVFKISALEYIARNPNSFTLLHLNGFDNLCRRRGTAAKYGNTHTYPCQSKSHLTTKHTGSACDYGGQASHIKEP